ncbi:hypothetical protein HPTD01_909 [Halomonas sp. TD01]|nr:hypothetical protein HPTD01_909 [Halomonas sp. TD01]
MFTSSLATLKAIYFILLKVLFFSAFFDNYENATCPTS